MDFDFAKLMTPPRGGWKCPGCGQVMDFPGACDPCGERWEQEQHSQHKAEAHSSVPSRFRWAKFESGELSRRVSASAKGSVWRVNPDYGTGPALGQQALEGLASMWPNVVIVGRSGSGKTSLACAMLRGFIDTSSLGYAARFVAVVNLAKCRKDARLGVEPELLEHARKASLVVLDDLGQEDSFGSDVVREFIHTRHNTGKPTIFTTWMNYPTLAKRYDDGTARRVFEGSYMLILDCNAAERAA